MQGDESLCCCGRHGRHRYYGQRRGFLLLVAGFKVVKLGMLQLEGHYWPPITEIREIPRLLVLKLGKQSQPQWLEIVSSKACLTLTSVQQRSATTTDDPKINVECSVLHGERTESNFKVTNLVTRSLSQLESKGDSEQQQ
jgi:hypothetical protein